MLLHKSLGLARFILLLVWLEQHSLELHVVCTATNSTTFVRMLEKYVGLECLEGNMIEAAGHVDPLTDENLKGVFASLTSI